MNNKKRKILSISLVASAISMLFTILFVSSREKKGARILGVVALLEAIVGFFVLLEDPRSLLRSLRRRAAKIEEVYEDVDAEEPCMDMSDIPCDDEATEADFA